MAITEEIIMENAVIEDAFIGTYRDGGIFAVGFHVKTSSGVSGYVGYSVGIKNMPSVSSAYLDFMCRVLKVIGVENWSELMGKYCRVSYIKPPISASNFLHWEGISHIMKDDHVYLSKECLTEASDGQHV